MSSVEVSFSRSPPSTALDQPAAVKPGDEAAFLAEVEKSSDAAPAGGASRPQQERLTTAALSLFAPTIFGSALSDLLKDAVPGYGGNAEATTGPPGKGDRTQASIAEFDIENDAK